MKPPHKLMYMNPRRILMSTQGPVLEFKTTNWFFGHCFALVYYLLEYWCTSLGQVFPCFTRPFKGSLKGMVQTRAIQSPVLNRPGASQRPDSKSLSRYFRSSASRSSTQIQPRPCTEKPQKEDTQKEPPEKNPLKRRNRKEKAHTHHPRGKKRATNTPKRSKHEKTPHCSAQSKTIPRPSRAKTGEIGS